ncbi:MAG: crossover junction endodeoxyribonuclease RuvC [Tissierellia bacterium]|nr:crossover junction endodeoxyribonuclease RuvC [Tissierellia bacterium]
MIIFGIDPGLAIVGYGIIQYDGNRYRAIDYGCIRTGAEIQFSKRLKIIYDELSSIIDKYKPDDLAIEELFFNKNAKTALKVGQARGVEILSAVNRGIEVYEYTPLQVKQAVAGYGRADKKQVQEMVKILLNLRELPRPDDAADALAVAICHSSCLKFKDMFKMK